jgi:hypothetical protein
VSLIGRKTGNYFKAGWHAEFFNGLAMTLLRKFRIYELYKNIVVLFSHLVANYIVMVTYLIVV